jgi:hypothetical protein
MDDLRYPIGPFAVPPDYDISPEKLQGAITEIAALPGQLREVVSGLDAAQLDTPYREGGWTVRQTVHHIADSHINSYIRFRLALTEDQPTIKPYDEKAWAELPDARTADVDLSLTLIEVLHERWVALLRSMSRSDFRRTFSHPEYGVRRLDWNTLLYGWHSKHHLAHISGVSRRLGWKSPQISG